MPVQHKRDFTFVQVTSAIFPKSTSTNQHQDPAIAKMCIRSLGLLVFMLFEKKGNHKNEERYQQETSKPFPKESLPHGGLKMPQTAVMDGPPQYDDVIVQGWPLRVRMP